MAVLSVLVMLLLGPLVVPATAQVSSVQRLEALGSRLGVGMGAAQLNLQSRPVKTTGDMAESLVCLTFDRRETRQTFGLRRARVYVCFNLLENPSEALGIALDRRGRQRCVVTGSFHAGPTAAEDCLVLSVCGNAFITGACGP